MLYCSTDSVNPVSFQEFLDVGKPQCFPYIFNIWGQLEMFDFEFERKKDVEFFTDLASFPPKVHHIDAFKC